ncbi:zinc finger CCCH domain-containing protein 14 [Malaya genurostris]|uniref:zinc finger CCCH domain-containing protein 14 n=1 Tax=Malaya genurostris TaxID=325434 RepID=UPI0026F3BF7B|nr:zinc finger CCCH domain-containing protein 14 [Malaya genurostris]
MDSLGSEIGQKMRSAVKAKLIELGTGSASGYIDDELPDYVMIMVANKRSRQQMIDDLQLFLGSQTEVFVNWLHQVLQKLEEVTLPASATSSITGTAKTSKDSSGKRKASEQKDKKEKKKDKKTKKPKEKTPEVVGDVRTPPHPAPLGANSIQDVFANQFIQQAKKSLDIDGSAPKEDSSEMTPPLRENCNSQTENEFDIPTISEIAGQTALQKHQKELCELEEIQQRIKQAKKQLKAMGSDESEDEDFLNIKANDEDLENIEDGGLAHARRKEKLKAQMAESEKHKEPEKEIRSDTPPPPVELVSKRKSVMERLGTRPEPKAPSEVVASESATNKGTIISLSAHRREERELYVPVFRRKEMEEQKAKKAREAKPVRANRSRSRERDRRRSPPSWSARRDNSRDRSRSRRDRDRDRERDRPKSRDRGRERERERERERDRGRSTAKVNNGTDVRTRIGSRVIVLPPKPEYIEEDELEVPIPSVVKVQPRPQIPKSKQPSKNLLLKAMAEAQRSTAANVKKTISNVDEIPLRHRRMLIEIPGANSESLQPLDVDYGEDDDDDEDIVNHVLGDDDEDDELQRILANANDEYIPEPVSMSISGRSDTDSDGYVYVPSAKLSGQAHTGSLEEYDPKDISKNPKFVVTLDGGAYKKTRTSPSHTPPPPVKPKLSIKDRIGVKVSPNKSEKKSTPPDEDEKDDRVHQETLKRRKERFSVKAQSKEAAKQRDGASKTSPEKRSKSSSSKKSSPTKRDKTARASNTDSNRKTSPGRDLNELLLQRTKELLVDDSVSSSPIYMSKTDYDKIEPNSSSRKRKRVSPIQFALTDEEADDTDGEYNHHRDRELRERKSVERAASVDEDSVGSRQDQRKERESERRGNDEERRKSVGTGSSKKISTNSSEPAEPKTPTKKIRKLESTRKFDDIPQLLSSVSVPSDGLSKSKATIKERCKYFPLCRQGDSCEFLHPSTMCKAFPACKFGDKCLYLHPFCKFDKTCHRLDCNYMHTKPLSSHGLGSSGTSAPPLASSVVPVSTYKSITAKPLPQMCKFYPGCTNGLCQYYHPKMCRFGKHCMNKVECNFYHHELPGGLSGLGDYPEAPQKDKFKWISPFSA